MFGREHAKHAKEKKEKLKHRNVVLTNSKPLSSVQIGGFFPTDTFATALPFTRIADTSHTSP